MTETAPPPEEPSPREQRQQRRQRRQQRRERRARRRGDSEQNAPAASAFTGVTDTPFVDREKRPLYLQDLYRGAVVFVMLSGLSTERLDLKQLDQRGIVTIGINQSPSLWRTTFWTYVDRARKFHDGIWKDPGILKIIPSRHFGKPLQAKVDGHFMPLMGVGGQSLRARDMPGVVGYKRNAFFNPDKWLSEPSINWGNSKKSARRNKHPRCLNVMFCVIKTAYALGFRRAYLLGCDFYMSNKRPYAFSQVKNEGGVASNNNAYRVMNEMFGLLKPKFDAAGFRVFNCNPDSGFAVFPHVSFDAAIADVTQTMPPEPWDTSDWYDTTRPLPGSKA